MEIMPVKIEDAEDFSQSMHRMFGIPRYHLNMKCLLCLIFRIEYEVFHQICHI